MLVPLNTSQPLGTDEKMLTPGALTSGFRPRSIPLGPADEKSAITSFLLTAAAVIALAASPGEETEPNPKSVKSLPAAIAGTTPASAAALIALTISGELPLRPTDGVGVVKTL